MKTMLLVDDDPDILAILKDSLDADFEIDMADNAELAISMAEKKSYDIILTDVVMPGTDGLALIRNLRASGVSSSILAITGFPELMASATKAGADACLEKPFTAQKLNDFLAACI